MSGSKKSKWSGYEPIDRARRWKLALNPNQARVTGPRLGNAKPTKSVRAARGRWLYRNEQRRKGALKDAFGKAMPPLPYDPPRGDAAKAVADARMTYWQNTLGTKGNPDNLSDAELKKRQEKAQAAKAFLHLVDVHTAVAIAEENNLPIAATTNRLLHTSMIDSPYIRTRPDDDLTDTVTEKQIQRALDTARRTEEAEVAASESEAQSARRASVQLALLDNMDQLVAMNGYKSTQGADKTKYPHREPKKLISFFGEPSAVVHRLISPFDACSFVHARPSELSSLVPQIAFAMRDAEGNETPVIFSDHVSGKKMLDLANIRSSGGLREILSSTDQHGLNVGVKSFDWTFENKHEGDKTVKANLVLYFGSISELVNEYYLRFLFTTGQPTTAVSPSLAPRSKGGSDPQSRAQKKRLIKDKLNAWEKTLKSGKRPAPASASTVKVQGLAPDKMRKNDFRQLSVEVGWGAPEGEIISPTGQRLFSDDFLTAIKGMKKNLLLNMVSYNLNFLDEGQVELNIEYVASIDAFYGKNTSDVLRGAALKGKDEINDRLIGAEINKPGTGGGFIGWFKGPTSRKSLVAKNGYLRSRMNKDKNYQVAIKEGEMVPGFRATLSGVLFEIEYLRLKVDYLREYSPNNTDGMKTTQGALGEAEVIYEEMLSAVRGQKYASFLQALIARGSMFVVSMRIPNPGEKVSSTKPQITNPPAPGSPQNAQQRVLAIATSDGKKVIESRVLDPSNRENHAGYEAAPNSIPLFYLRLGDIIDTAIVNMGIDRQDVSVLLGSFSPVLAGIPAPIKGTTFHDLYYSLADIPVSFDYFGHWFMENVVAKERETYAFRHFMNDLMNGLVADLINFVSDKAQTHMMVDFTSATLKNNFKEGSFLTQESISGVTAQGKLKNYFITFARQLDPERRIGNRTMDEEDGIYHLILGADTGILKGVNFQEKSMPQYRAMKIENANQASAAAGALIIPQDAACNLFGNALFQNGQLVYINAELGLGRRAADVLKLGGYYRIYRVDNSIGVGSYETTIECKYDDPRQIHTRVGGTE